MSILPEAPVLLAYAAACLVLFITPGPDMSLFLSRTLTGGRAAGLAALLGTSAGCCVHTVLAALGVSALLAASATAFAVLKVLGAAYLLWLAYGAIRHGSTLDLQADRRPPAAHWRSFLVGLGINLTNPKIVLFFVTFLPQFIDGQDPDAAGKLVVLGLLFVGGTAPLAVLLILGAERAVGFLTRRPRVTRAIDYLFAGVFAAFALRIATAPSR